MEWGQFIKYFKAWSKQGRSVKAWDERPILFEDIIPVWNAFIFLNQRRPFTHDYLPIPLADIAAYFDIIGIRDYEKREEWLEHINELDKEWLKLQREKGNTQDANLKSGNRRTQSQVGRGGIQRGRHKRTK